MVTGDGFSPLPINSAAEEAFFDDMVGADVLDETESFTEEDFLFVEEDVDSDEALYKGGFAHYSRKAAKSSLLDKLSQSVQSNDRRGILTESNALRIAGSCDEQGSSRLHTGNAIENTKENVRRARHLKKNSLSIRENLLAEAWERKRGLWLSEEAASFNVTAVPELLRHSCSSFGERSRKDRYHDETRDLRTRSLTDDDFEELRGCIDLNFQFDQSAVPDLCKTLPALEVYCAVAQSFEGSPISCSPVTQSPTQCLSPSGTPSWRVASPGDEPSVVKGKLRHWAQAVACHARLCS